MILSETVDVKISSKNKEYYLNLGYEIPTYKDSHRRISVKKGTVIAVNVCDLPLNSHAQIRFACDNCGKEGVTTYQCYKQSEHDGKKYCRKCSANIVTKQVWMEKYGVSCSLHAEDISQKVKLTNLERYGTENAFASEIIKEKIKKINIEKLGVEYPMQSQIIQEKSKQTCLKKYGVEYSLQSEEVRSKGMKKMSENGIVPTSSQQLNIYDAMKKKYGDENVQLNLPLSNIALDIALSYEGQLFDVEYDCYYWHKEKNQQDRRRDEFTKACGYRVLRIKSGHLVPSIEEIHCKIEEMIRDDRKYSEIILSDWQD
jgi:hypothetical protein